MYNTPFSIVFGQCVIFLLLFHFSTHEERAKTKMKSQEIVLRLGLLFLAVTVATATFPKVKIQSFEMAKCPVRSSLDYFFSTLIFIVGKSSN
jgi:hypothetical protein